MNRVCGINRTLGINRTDTGVFWEDVDLNALSTSNWTTVITGYVSIRSFSTNPFRLGVNSTALSVDGFGAKRTNVAFDLTNANSITLKGSAKTRDNKTFKVHVINKSSGYIVKTYTSQTDQGYGFTFDTSIDVSSLSGDHYVEVGIYTIKLTDMSYVKFTDFKIIA